MQPLLRRHWPFAIVLIAAALLRGAAELAYWPALFYSDSWGYLSMAEGPGLVTFAPLRPSGYPLALTLLPGELGAATVAQHVAGMAGGMLVYALLLRLGVGRALAAAAAAVVLLDAWAVALEQHILAEAFFTLALALGAFLTLWRPMPKTWQLAAAGVLLAGATLMRPVALAATVPWLVYLLWLRPPRRGAVLAVGALALPLVVYSLAHSSATGTFGLTQADGWFLYGRVGEIATRYEDEGPNFFIFNRRSPARREFPRFDERSNRIMRARAFDAIRDEPGEYARIVARDFLKYLRPGPRSRYREDSTIEFPARRSARFEDDPARTRLYPGLRPRTSAPNGALRSYAAVFHTSRPLLALMILAAVGALALRRLEKRAAAAVSLTLAMAVAMLVASAMTAGFALRYLVPEVALLVVSGTLSIRALGERWGSAAGR